MADHISKGQQRLLKTLTLLAGHEVNGLRPSQITKSLNCAASQTTVDLRNLQAAGLAEQIPDSGTWRLGPKLIQIAQAHQSAIARAEDRLRETRQRFSRSPH